MEVFGGNACQPVKSYSLDLLQTAALCWSKKREQQIKQTKLEMWANAQRDGRPAEYR